MLGRQVPSVWFISSLCFFSFLPLSRHIPHSPRKLRPPTVGTIGRQPHESQFALGKLQSLSLSHSLSLSFSVSLSLSLSLSCSLSLSLSLRGWYPIFTPSQSAPQDARALALAPPVPSPQPTTAPHALPGGRSGLPGRRCMAGVEGGGGSPGSGVQPR